MNDMPSPPRRASASTDTPSIPIPGVFASIPPLGLSVSAPTRSTLPAPVSRSRTIPAGHGRPGPSSSHAAQVGPSGAGGSSLGYQPQPAVPSQVEFARSAPTSPAGQTHISGLAPLSRITPIQLGPAPMSTAPSSSVNYAQHAQPSSSQTASFAASQYVAQRGNVQPSTSTPTYSASAGFASSQGQIYQRNVPQPLAGPSNTHHQAYRRPQAVTSALPPLLNPAARIRVGTRLGKFSMSGSGGSASSTASETETEGADSDSTFVPGRGAAIRHKQSLSQPDLTALRSRLEGWAGGVAKGQAEEKKAREAKRKTPPTRPAVLQSQPAPLGQRAKSQTALSGMRKSPSPRISPALISPMTPVLSSSSDGSSPRFGSSYSTGGGGHDGSEDADDDWDGTLSSPSSGSLTFSPKRRPRHKQLFERERGKGSLGLSFGPEITPPAKDEPLPMMLERRLQHSSLFWLRALAVIPSLWGMAVLFLASISGDLWVDAWPWGVDWSREALERLVAGGPALDGPIHIVARGDMILAMAWAACTAHFCFHLTTGLTHRWRSYYSLPGTLTRLLSLQCLCWPMTYLTLRTLGAQRPLLAWIVIGVTTGWSRTIQMWVTSNVVGASGSGRTGADTTPKARSPPLPPKGAGWWDAFVFGRRWDWDEIAREVGWKIGGLLLCTCAWMFWKLESGQLVEVGDAPWRKAQVA